MNEGMSAMGSDTRQGIDMAVSIINGLISGDMTGATAGALAPKIATIIKQHTEGDIVANTVSHAILGAVVAELQGNSALVGGLGAAVSECGAEVIAGILYPNKDIKDLSQEERQKVSALSQLATGLAIAASGGDIQDVNTGVAAGKNAVENNGLSWGDGGFGGDFIGLSPETGANYEGILHASAAGYLTQEETEEALERLITGKDMPNGSDYVELWMRAPEQIGAFLPGPISAAMAALAMADKALTDTDKADLISVLNKATGDYLSGANTESLLELNTVLSRLGAKSSNKQFQDFIKEKVENNVAKSQKGNKSSKFGEHVKNENQITENWNNTNQAHNVANSSKLKDNLTNENLNNIAKQDPRLSAVVKGGNRELNYGVGTGTSAEANKLGMIWVGDGAKQTSNGGWISADGTRGYRPPSSKPNSPYAETGVQANFETYKFDVDGKRIKVGNGHLNIKD
ncbi:VENN motif pre-toxin domain-containing protein [Gilliamella sp. Bif1-4]|uniref:VENN motif pre-toxin domain-containing protein n=2 Tax=Gilliamella sp. Bif1-4 TaxID=3120233 RepID=UPI0009C127BE|nr:VENN motif pre-toxin domain-containing protein [Gilliamella apicola]